MTRPQNEPPYTPSELRIQIETAKIRRRWSEGETRLRATGKSAKDEYDVPTVPAKLLLGPGASEFRSY